MESESSRKTEKGMGRVFWKNFTRQQWMVLILLGLLLVVIALPVTKKTEDSDTSSASLFGDTVPSSTETIPEKTQMEQKLQGILEQVDGVGQVEVMLYVTDENALFSQTGEEAGNVGGALIVAQGADNPVIVEKIQDAVLALFPMEAHKIKVMKMK